MMEKTNVPGLLLGCLLTVQHISIVTDATRRTNIKQEGAVSTQICSPTWTEVPVQTEMHMSPGEDLELRCPAHGKPKPTIQWFKDGELLTKRFDSESITMKGWRLFISNVISTHDEGVYECVVKNKCGELRHSTQVFIQVRMNGPPVFFELPRNTNVTEGESAVITCRAYSDLVMYTQWIKHDQVNGSYTDEQGQPHFHRLESQDNIFVNATHLIIFNTTLNDSGLYTCYIANQLGSIHYSSWISVTTSVLSPMVLPSMLGLPPTAIAAGGGVLSVILLISVSTLLVVACIRCRKKKGDHQAQTQSDSVKQESPSLFQNSKSLKTHVETGVECTTIV